MDKGSIHYCFFNHELKFQDSVCNGCHDLTMLFLNISNIVVITVKNVACCVFSMGLANLKQLIY